MDPQIEMKLLQSIYDNIYDLVTQSPGGDHSPVFNEREIVFQMIPFGQPIHSDDFSNMLSPSNPEGLAGKSEAFSRFIDPIPAVSADYRNSMGSIEKVYDNIMTGARIVTEHQEHDPETEKNLDEARNILYESLKINYRGEEKEFTKETPIYKAYKENRSKYLSAIGEYRDTLAGLNMNNPDDQQKWLALAPSLQNKINDAWESWRSFGASEIEDALAFIGSVAINAPALILQRNKEVWNQTKLPSTVGLNDWHMPLVYPTNWYDPSAEGFFKFSINSESEYKSTKSKYGGLGGGGSFTKGLWGIGADLGNPQNSEFSRVESNKVELSMELGIVNVSRTWLDLQFLRSDSWNMEGYYAAGKISAGDLQASAEQNSAMPLIPVAMVVARNIIVKGEWATEVKERVDKAKNAGVSIGFGPFRFGGKYKSGGTEEITQKHNEDGSIEVKGIQVMGWLSQIVPYCPSK